MKNETIIDKVVLRLKLAPIGDLITEEDLHEIVKSALPKVFFEKELVREATYNSAAVSKDAPIITIMREVLEARARELVTAWVGENSEMMARYWKEVMDAGLLLYVTKMQDEMATASIRGALMGWFNKINQDRAAQGLPMIYP